MNSEDTYDNSRGFSFFFLFVFLLPGYPAVGMSLTDVKLADLLKLKTSSFRRLLLVKETNY